MNMFLHELKAYRKSTTIWAASLVLLAIFMFSMFPSISKDAESFKKLLDAYPPTFRKALGLSVDSVTSLFGFYSSFVLLYEVLCGAIQAMNLGTAIISKEVREKTADFLLTKPIKRHQIITSKLLAAVVSLIITNVIYITSASIIAEIVKNKSFDYKIFLLLSMTLFLVQLMFMSFGILVSVIMPKIRSVLPISISTVLGFFFIEMFSSIIGDKAARYITPFKYYDYTYIIAHSAYEYKYVLVELMFIIISISISYIIYAKKDIHAV
ncbi:MAG: ABC transporter permease subunit [Clostridium sp.]|nr:ABC transporter permease subunit [Clostridium sp.]